MTPNISKLRVFISWAGPQAEALAKGFHTFLPDVVNAIEPFLSGSDIDKGSRWNDVLKESLQASSCAIVCLTPESTSSVWVAFETGAVSRAAGSPENARTRIWTYLHGLTSKDIQLSPFASYQATFATESDTFKLVRSINGLSSDQVSEDSLKRRFDQMFWPNFSRVVDEASKVSKVPQQTQSSEVDVLAEILRTVRAIQTEIRSQPLAREARMRELHIKAGADLLLQRLRSLGITDAISVRIGADRVVFNSGGANIAIESQDVEDIICDTEKRVAISHDLYESLCRKGE
jgi:hypothetical protein